jgi:hypothetical protein
VPSVRVLVAAADASLPSWPSPIVAGKGIGDALWGTQTPRPAGERRRQEEHPDGPTLARLALPRLRIDVDGSVVRTGATVGWAFRGFNPHHRKDPSYHPLVAHVAQTGHILRLKHRPGNVHDSKQAVPFLRDIIDDLRGRFGRRVALEFRMDAAFFQREILQLLAARDCGYAIKVGYWSWLPLKSMAAACRRWQPVAPGVTDHATGDPWSATQPSHPAAPMRRGATYAQPVAAGVAWRPQRLRAATKGALPIRPHSAKSSHPLHVAPPRSSRRSRPRPRRA